MEPVERGPRGSMDIRQVALGAAFGAAVAVNAALQSLHDAGSFLIHPPPFQYYSAELDSTTDTDRSYKRGGGGITGESESHSAIRVDEIEAEERAWSSVIEDGASIAENDGEEVDTEGSDYDDLEEAGSSSSVARQARQASTAHHPITTGSSKRRKLDAAPAMLNLPFLSCMAQTEEAMSVMLQETTNTVMNALADAKGRRESIMSDLTGPLLAEKESSLKLVNNFIDALVNVSDSLVTVQSALFNKKDVRSHSIS